MTQPGPQYHRGGQARPEDLNQTRPMPPEVQMPAPPVGGANSSLAAQPMPESPMGAPVGSGVGGPAGDPVSYEPAPQQSNFIPEPLSPQNETGEQYGYDYRYADGMDEGYIRGNPTGWFALILALAGTVLAWDRLGAFVALPILIVSFVTGLVALSLSGRRKWYSWIAVILSSLAGLWALVTVIVGLVALLGGFHYSGSASLFGLVEIQQLKIPGISDITMSFPNGGLSFVTLR